MFVCVCVCVFIGVLLKNLRLISAVHVKISTYLEKSVQRITFTKFGTSLFFDYLRDISVLKREITVMDLMSIK